MSIKSPKQKKPAAIRPGRARYIKLGAGGEWEDECIEKGIIRFGFGSERPERFPLCRAGKWDQLTQSFIAGGRTRGTATRSLAIRQCRAELMATQSWLQDEVAELCKELAAA